ncbi:MAG: hypothetical protein GAK35_02859 [Herbaspirillum frisingense]|uniref:DUF3649 domain-containing protein n=1 Tax=Herbaspirillum frisingense TaxID=92645 RepID=A0A7V8JTT1_9BURK|nr:MAG: hypothetical protein GAK35_02859 [Herbaspirillum frisingense]
MKARGDPWRLALRFLAAGLGGYAWASLAATAIAFAMPWCCGWSRAEGVLTGSLLGFAFYLGAAIWAFSARSTALVVACAMLAGVLDLWILAA